MSGEQAKPCSMLVRNIRPITMKRGRSSAVFGHGEDRCSAARLCSMTAILGLASVWFATSLSSPARGEDEAAKAYPELVDITASTGIHFEHHSSPEQKFIVE